MSSLGDELISMSESGSEDCEKTSDSESLGLTELSFYIGLFQRDLKVC